MSNIALCFLVTSLAGLSTFIGSFLIFIKVKNENRVIASSLFFSSLVILYVSLFDLIPASFNYLLEVYNIFISLLIFITYFMMGFILVKVFSKDSTNSLYKVGVMTMISLILHNIPEGIITFISLSKNVSLGFSLSLSIALHNIPEGIIIAVPIYYSTKSRGRALFYTLVASLSEPLGGFIAFLFLHNINNYLFAILLSLTSGIMIYLSVFELLKEAYFYIKK